jgi:arginine deiminase
MKPRIFSEYGKLKKVIVHTPGAEHNQVIPWEGDHPLMGEYPRVYQQLRQNHKGLKDFLVAEAGAENVLEVADLLRDIFEGKDYAQRQRILSDTLFEVADTYIDHLQARGIKLEKYPATEIVRDLIEGYPRVLTLNNGRLPNVIIPPKRELMWVRDSSATTPCGVVINAMASPRRSSEPTLLRAIFRHHPMFDRDSIFLDLVDFNRKMEQDLTSAGIDRSFLLEGGNILILSEDTLAVGVGHAQSLYSNRTTRAAFELLVARLLAADTEKRLRRIYLVNVPDLRGFIHLDTVFNMVGPKSAIVMPYIFGLPHPEVEESAKRLLQRFVGYLRKSMAPHQTDLSKIPGRDLFERAGLVEVYDRDYIEKKGQITHLPQPARYFLDQLIIDGLLDPAKITWVGGDMYDHASPYEHLRVALFEQHNMAGNVFATAPYRVVAYHRNETSAATLLRNMQPHAADAHVELMPSNEIRTDNGGPHCLTMPLERE